MAERFSWLVLMPSWILVLMCIQQYAFPVYTAAFAKLLNGLFCPNEYSQLFGPTKPC